MDDTSLPSMPAEPDLPSKEVPNASTNGTSLIQSHTIQAKRSVPIVLWLLVLISLLGTAGIGYMLYTQQNSLNNYISALADYQNNVTQWSNQVSGLQTTVQGIQAQINILTATPVVSTAPTGLYMNTVLPLSSALPTATNQLGDDALDKIDNMRVTSSPETEPSLFAENSLSDGRLSDEDEMSMLNTYLREIVAGQHKTTQPDGLSTFRSRETSSDGQLTYDIFRSSTDDDVFFIYVRKGPDTAPNGWYGPFSAFPSS